MCFSAEKYNQSSCKKFNEGGMNGNPKVEDFENCVDDCNDEVSFRTEDA